MKTRFLLNANLRWFMLGMILANIAGEMVYSMMSLYLRDRGASVAQVGLVFTLAGLVPMALQLFGGWLSDTIGRLRAIAIGSSVAVLGYMVFFLAPSWEWVLAGLCLELVSNSFVGPSFAAYIAEQSDESARGRVYGITRGIYMVVTVIGPALAGFLVGWINFQPMLQVAFTFYALATAVRIWMATAERFAPVKKPEKPSFSGLKLQMTQMAALLFTGGILLWIWITDAINDTAYTLTGDLYPLYLSSVGGLAVEKIGLLGSIWGLASILGSFAGGWLTDRFRERSILSLGFLLVTLGMALMLLAGSLPGFAIARVLNGLGVGVLMPAYDSLISKVVPENKRGLAFGLFGTSLGILSLPMPWIGAQLWEHIAPAAPFWVTVAACAFSILIAWWKLRQPALTEGKAPESMNITSP